MNKQTEYTVQYLENLGADTTVSPPVMRRALVGKASDGSYYDIPVNLDGTPKTSTNFEGGQVTVGLTEVEITFSGTTKSILIQADQDNTDYIYIGKAGVTTSTGMVKLDPGRSVTLELNDTDNAIYAISGTAGQIIHKMALL